MKRSLLSISLFLALAIGIISALPGTANAWERQYHHLYMRQSYYHRYGYRRYHRMATRSYLDQVYGAYPNIRYFQRNGHVYYRNLDTGRVYLAHW